jgi:hypothetical protein
MASPKRATSATSFSAEALADLIERNRTRDAESQARAITARAFDYAGTRLEDDVAALVVKIVRDSLPGPIAVPTPVRPGTRRRPD